MPPPVAVVKLRSPREINVYNRARGFSLEATDEPNGEAAMAEAPRPRAFSASELVQCSACSRANPPTRGSCLYCGATLEITELNAFASAPMTHAEATSNPCFHVLVMSPARI